MKSDELLRDPAARDTTLTPIASAQLLAESFYPRDTEETDTSEQRECRAEVAQEFKFINERPLELTNFTAAEGSLKVLGLTVDHQLNFREHLAGARGRAVTLSKRVARTASAGWGLNSNVLRIIYQTVVEPTVLYAANVWAEAAKKKYNRVILERTARQFAILISKTHRTTSFTSAAALSGILPLDLRAQEQLKLYEVRRGRPLPELPDYDMERRLGPFDLPHPALRGGARLPAGVVGGGPGAAG
ncbi:unnamed protein product [Arctia plantaginis]|uniref:Uncharacterized protein n=1 Tax=Arctia plantaginis TaxID=874455 RepID=A0A8S0ZVQ9_ARCPL|nr:unnamed protein product [Arctia plantaginis]